MDIRVGKDFEEATVISLKACLVNSTDIERLKREKIEVKKAFQNSFDEPEQVPDVIPVQMPKQNLGMNVNQNMFVPSFDSTLQVTDSLNTAETMDNNANVYSAQNFEAPKNHFLNEENSEVVNNNFDLSPLAPKIEQIIPNTYSQETESTTVPVISEIPNITVEPEVSETVQTETVAPTDTAKEISAENVIESLKDVINYVKKLQEENKDLRNTVIGNNNLLKQTIEEIKPLVTQKPLMDDVINRGL